MHDTRFAACVAGIAHEPKFGFRPGFVNIPCGAYRCADVVATLNEHRGNVFDYVQVPDDLVIGIKESAIDEIVAFDTGEGHRERIGIDVAVPFWIGPQ